MIGYGRFTADECVCVLVQTTEQKKTVRVPVWRLGMPDGSFMASMMSCGTEGFSIEAKLYKVKDGCDRGRCDAGRRYRAEICRESILRMLEGSPE